MASSIKQPLLPNKQSQIMFKLLFTYIMLQANGIYLAQHLVKRAAKKLS